MYENYDDEDDEFEPDLLKIFHNEIMEANNKLFELEKQIKELKNNNGDKLKIECLIEEYEIIHADYLSMVEWK